MGRDTASCLSAFLPWPLLLALVSDREDEVALLPPFFSLLLNPVQDVDIGAFANADHPDQLEGSDLTSQSPLVLPLPFSLQFFPCLIDSKRQAKDCQRGISTSFPLAKPQVR